jgi:copper chaperone CopZ
MHCGSCSALIEETLGADPAVSQIAVDLDGARATVTFDPSATDVASLCAEIAKLGYGAAPAAEGIAES